MQHNDIAERLRQLADELVYMATVLGGNAVEVAFPEEARQRLAAGVCLERDCTKRDKRHGGKHQFRRGNCPSHYNQLSKLLIKNPAYETELIRLGRMTPVGYTLEPKEIDELKTLLDSPKVAASAAIVLGQAADAKKARKPRKSKGKTS